MADPANDNSPLVKLAVAILDDPYGISTVAWERLIDTFQQFYGSELPPPLIRKIIQSIKGGEGRLYLPEDWNK